jgi:hypothetical protein
MRAWTRAVAVMQLALICPAGLFLTAVLVGTGDPPQYDLALVAHRIGTWYTARTWTLPTLLLALPFAALGAGGATLLRSWRGDTALPRTARPSLATIPAPIATLFVAGLTFTSAGILAVVVLHMLAN